MGSVGAALGAVLALVWDVLQSDPEVARRLLDGDMLWPAFGVLMLAALSIGIGHSSVLFLNRIRPLRVGVAAAVGLLWILLLRLVEALVTWAVARVVTGQSPPWQLLLTIFLLATAPHVFHAFTFLPWLGLLIGRVLDIWSFLVLFVLIGSVYRIPAPEAMAITASGWLVIQVLSRVLARPLSWLGSRLWTLATGTAVLITPGDILAGFPLVPVTTDPGDDP